MSANKYIKKITVISLVLTLCLAVIGVGYAGWFGNLYIEGTTNTGEVDIEFVADTVETSDNEQPYVPNGPPDVATVSASLLDGADGDGDMSVMSVSLEHGYYCYVGMINFDVRNNGTVPIKVTSINVTEPLYGEVDVLLSGISVGNGLNPGQSISCVLMAHVTTNVHGNYNFSVAIDVANWNEEGG